jgi:hypothetical protein
MGRKLRFVTDGQTFQQGNKFPRSDRIVYYLRIVRSVSKESFQYSPVSSLSVHYSQRCRNFEETIASLSSISDNLTDTDTKFKHVAYQRQYWQNYRNVQLFTFWALSIGLFFIKKQDGWIMSTESIIVFIYHRHKLLDLKEM